MARRRYTGEREREREREGGGTRKRQRVIHDNIFRRRKALTGLHLASGIAASRSIEDRKARLGSSHGASRFDRAVRRRDKLDSPSSDPTRLIFACISHSRGAASAALVPAGENIRDVAEATPRYHARFLCLVAGRPA